MTDEPKLPPGAVALPEGVEMCINVFFTSDKHGFVVKMSLDGYKALPPIGHFERIDGRATLPPIADDWRRMTKEEIEQYKEDEKPGPNEVTHTMPLHMVAGLDQPDPSNPDD